MPKIAQYDAPEGLGLRPTETGISAVAGAARRVQGDYSEAAASQEATGQRLGSAISTAGNVAVKYIEHQEISHGASGFAGLVQAKSKQWDDISKNADPNDPTVANKFLAENLEPDLEKFKTKGFITEGGQQWAESHVAQFRQHMFHKTSADMSTRAGEAAVINTRQTINGLSNTVRSDPSSMDFALKTLETSLGGVVDSSPNLTGVQAGKVKTGILEKGKEDIIMSAAMGYAEKTGKVPSWASDPKYSKYIEIADLEKAARGYDRLNKAEVKAARAEREDNEDQTIQSALLQLEAKTMPKNIGDSPTVPREYMDDIRKIIQAPGAERHRTAIHQAIRNGEILADRMNKPEALAPVSHATTMELMKRLRATDESRLTDNGPIYEALQDGKLNKADFNFLNREFAAMRTPDGQALEKDRGQFSKTFARLIDGSMNQAGVHSLLGTQRMYEFEMDARRQEEALRKTPGGNPHDVYDPRSPHFFGRPENIAKYRVTMQEAQKYEKTMQATDTAKEADIEKARAAAKAAEKNLPRPKSKEERDALRPGTKYIDPNGDIRARE